MDIEIVYRPDPFRTDAAWDYQLLLALLPVLRQMYLYLDEVVALEQDQELVVLDQRSQLDLLAKALQLSLQLILPFYLFPLVKVEGSNPRLCLRLGLGKPLSYLYIDLEMKGMSRALVLKMKGMLMTMAMDLPLENL